MPQQFLIQNLPVLKLSLALTFFVLGFVILLQYWQYNHLSSLKLAKELWLLAVFGMGLGLAEGLEAVLPLVTPASEALRAGLVAAGYIALYLYGARLLLRSRPTAVFIRHSIRFLVLLGVVTILAALFTPQAPLMARLNASLLWASLVFGLPGSALVALALTAQVRDFQAITPLLVPQLYGAVASFSLYGLLTGLNGLPALKVLLQSPPVVWREAPSSLWPGVLLAISGLGMGYFLLRIMQIFDLENCHKLEKAREEQTILQERLRISRDLHDGVIQSLYGIGLALEQTRKALPAGPQTQVDHVLAALNETVESLRYYIMDLPLPDLEGRSLTEVLTDLGTSFGRESGLAVELHTDVAGPLFLTPQQVNQVYHMVREALNNVARHAQASRVRLSLEQGPGGLVLSIADDGQGLGPRPVSPLRGRGLANLLERAHLLGGELQVRGGPGTTIQITIPQGR